MDGLVFEGYIETQSRAWCSQAMWSTCSVCRHGPQPTPPRARSVIEPEVVGITDTCDLAWSGSGQWTGNGAAGEQADL
jgi:hypothetical protein